jgi:predicted RecB family nuclease
MNRTPHLTKSKYLAGRQCARRVWLACHRPGLAAQPDAGKEAIFDQGHAVGRAARALFPGGVLVADEPWEHARAMETTRRLLADAVPAIFEAAFEHEGVRIRADVLERLPGGHFGLREVKAAARVKREHLDDCALQQYVLEGCGLRIDSVELVHVNRGFVRGAEAIDWREFFTRADLTCELARDLRGVPWRVAEMRAWVGASAEPDVEPSPHCLEPHECEFWDHCTRHKPADWVFHLPHLSAERFHALRARGIERITSVPDDFPLTALQRTIRDALRSGRPFVSPELGSALGRTGPPAAYLDFESTNPAIPLYPGTSPFQQIPFQWSLHRVNGHGTPAHREYLAAGDVDPRAELADALLAAVAELDASEPVLVYSGFESRILRDLIEHLPQRRPALEALRARLVDLLPLVRRHVYHPGFAFSYSVKDVAPALAAGFDYAGLEEVSSGGVASASFAAIASGAVAGDEAQRLRAELRAYCARDTLALVEIHRALLGMAKPNA